MIAALRILAMVFESKEKADNLSRGLCRSIQGIIMSSASVQARDKQITQFPVTERAIASTAKSLFDDIQREKGGTEAFAASKGWFARFQREKGGTEAFAASKEIDTTLGFLSRVKRHSLEFVDDVYAPTYVEVLEGIEAEEEQCVPEEGDIITLEYKTNAVEYWKSGKRKRLTLVPVKRNVLKFYGKRKRLTLVPVKRNVLKF
ncbi:Tc5 transposase DNA-binding domain [Popillia japonica]|uniref:Tc5 transposase DNA-binding domain n=1 Tax=Popillia japonica TaxID=7064 RepID=A0AAW1JGW7_POPJA